MNPDLQSLYRETLLNHSRSPRNRATLESANAFHQMKNPLCGDTVTIFLQLDEKAIRQVTFEAQCCSICMASASMLTERLLSQTDTNAIAIAQSLIHQLKNGKEEAELESNDTLNALFGVREFPSRIRCATLPWEAFQKAIGKGRNVNG